MIAVERLGSYISRGVYTVSGPFHPFGGAVDIIVVEQQDGSFKSSPWYVRFGKFQGVLKTKEKVVRINVNGVEAGFNMYLDHKGEAYFLRETNGEGGEGESLIYASSSSDETDTQSSNKTEKSDNCDVDTDGVNLIAQTGFSNGKIVARTKSRRARFLGLVFGRRSLKEKNSQDENSNGGIIRASSLERAEIAADLLEVRWSTNLATPKPRRESNASRFSDSNVMVDEVGKDLNSSDEGVELSSFVDDNSKLDGSVDKSSEQSSFLNTTEKILDLPTSNEGIYEERVEIVSKLTIPDSNTQNSSKLEYVKEQVFDEKKFLPEYGELLKDETLNNLGLVQDGDLCNVDSRKILVDEETCNRFYKDNIITESASLSNVQFQTASSVNTTVPADAEVIHQITVAKRVVDNISLDGAVRDLENQPDKKIIYSPTPENTEKLEISDEPTAILVQVDSCTIGGATPSISNSVNPLHSQGNKGNRDKIVQEISCDCIQTEILDEEQFLCSDLDNSKLSEILLAESISMENRGKEKMANDTVTADPKYLEENMVNDYEELIEKSRILSSPISIPKSRKDAGAGVGRMVESLPTLSSQRENIDASDVRRPLSFSLDWKSKRLDWETQRKDVSSFVNSGEEKENQILQEPFIVEKITVHTGETEIVSSNPEVGVAAIGGDNIFEPKELIGVDKILESDQSEAIVASGGNWRLWPFSFRRSNSTKAGQPTLSGSSRIDLAEDESVSSSKDSRKRERAITPTSEQLASLNLKEGRNVVTFTFSTPMLGKQEVDARIYLWKWNTRIVISDVDGTITKSDVLGQFMPLVGVDWSQTGVAHLFSAIKENGYQLLFLSARAISQAYHTRQFLFNLKQDGKALPDGPVVISPDGLFPSLFREVIRRAPHEFKIACLQAIRALFPSDCNPFYAGFGNRDTDEISYLKVGIPKGKIFIINPQGQIAVNRRVATKSYTCLHDLVHDMFPPMATSEQEDFNTWNFWKLPPPELDL